MSQWIAITAKHQHLRKVHAQLRRAGHNAYLPALCRRKAYAKGGRLRRRRRIVPLMSYVLVEIPHPKLIDLWLLSVLDTKHVAGFLKSGDGPAIVRENEIEAVRASVSMLVKSLEAHGLKRWLRSGAKARIANGSLAGKAGTVQWIRGKKAGLEAMLFGASRVVEVKLEDLEAA